MDVVYLDFSKAFDTVSYSTFLEKLAAHALGKCIIHWVKTWMDGQTQRGMTCDLKFIYFTFLKRTEPASQTTIKYRRHKTTALVSLQLAKSLFWKLELPLLFCLADNWKNLPVFNKDG